MVHPIFTVLVSRPELVMDHIAGYAALAQEEASGLGVQVKRRAAAWGAVAIGGLVFLILAGVAAMLGALLHEFHWALVVVPAIPLVIVVVGWMIARQPMPASAFTELRAQLDADAQTLRTIGAKS
ncbi:hypothetical protein UC35_16740 [Ramlibacter tataouinensis]|uniref:Candidate membrane protein n=1 Tax=Ramlibacter tataouinensis TaxID=94132 RepID=A0A127JZZ4_9BURK|nr:hypothetical protein UC35_16740 [Ramlibacter tataouinensis]